MATASQSVSIAFVRSALQNVPAARRALLLQRCGVVPDALADDRARVAAAAFGALWLAVAREIDDEFFGLDARRMKPGSFALLCHALAAAATVGQGLRLAVRGFNLFFDDVQASLTLAGREARLALVPAAQPARPDPEARRFADETLLIMLHGLLCWLAGARVPVARLDMAHPRPAHADEYRRMFSPQCSFDAARTQLVFDPRVLAQRAAVDAAALKAFLRDAPRSVFMKQVADSHAAFGERLRRRLRRAGSHWPTLEVLADELRLSPATLRRRLQAEGTSWRRLKDELRHERALALLGEGRLSVAEIASRLGYEDASAFHRAFRRRAGTTPAAARRATPDNAAP
ncbi:MAG: AraC family transcriptional regulator ligand-binding domain-containing protein [Burkholderiales bacterium]|nr:AraC family transcriptional regulator ligand-binding domain-containing protein [Burkholderiales bacterium]